MSALDTLSHDVPISRLNAQFVVCTVMSDLLWSCLTGRQ